jgi:hypothetical protein
MDPANQPSKRLRFGFCLRVTLVVIGLISVAISILLWLLSYFGLFCFSIYTDQHDATVNSYKGRMSLVISKEPPNSQPDQSWSMGLLPSSEQHDKMFASRPAFRFAQRHNLPLLIFAPCWTPTALSLIVLLATLRGSRRFTTRSLLITTTIAAMLFGAIAWSIRSYR